LLHLVYIAGNAACLGVGASQLDSSASVLLQVGLQAGSLSLVNLIPLYAGPHLDFLADNLGVSRRTIQQMHRSIAAVVMMLTTFHTIATLATKQSFPLDRVQNLSAVLVGDPFSASLADS
jgi:heme A synthase